MVAPCPLCSSSIAFLTSARDLCISCCFFFPLQVCEKYPEWLAVQAEALTKEDYERYGTQYQYFQRIVAVYETEPDNFPRIMELMQDVQQYGQPPAEIIKELAPGLEFNAEGMPVMPGLGATMTPSDLPGMPGIPFPETTPDGQPCSVM